ncbi:MAG: flippase [Flavobacteriales bacterium]|jgi:O-antigen/teichoic acid export membrane protein|nr:flippase [Flavobacteriales bacterium]MBK9077150.1 flippase [Flavobacteriales bacterium]MBK9538569.1 flippase [Flavobacteriales bacterium]
MLRTEGFRKYLNNTSWLLGEQVIRLVVVLVTGIYVARYLGDSLFGQLNYATGFVGMFFALSAMGVDQIIARDLVNRPERRDALLGTAGAIKLMGSAALLIIVAVVSWAKEMESSTAVLVLIIAAAELLKPFTVIEQHFMANVKADRIVRVQFTQVLLSAAMKMLLIWMGASLIWFAWIYVVEGVIVAIGYTWLLERDGISIRTWRVSRATMGYVLGQSWPMLVYGVALYIQAKIDQVMIGDLLARTDGQEAAYAEVGQYSVALKMIEALGFLPVIVQKSLAPAVTRARAEDPALYADRMLNLYRLMFLLFLITSVPLFFVAEPMIVWMYGEEFRPAGFLLSLFAIRLFFTNMGVAKASFITNESLFRYSLLTAIIGAGLNIAINYLLIPEYRSIGAIWATIISFAVSLFLLDLCFKRTRVNLGWMLKGIGTFWRFHRAN